MADMENREITEQNLEQNSEQVAENTEPEVDYKALYEAEKARSSKLKTRVDEVCSEAARFKKELRSHMSDEEQRNAEALEKQTAMEAELAELKREKRLGSLTTEYMALGMSKEDAYLTAQAKENGDESAVFANLKTLIDGINKNAAIKALDGQKGLSTGAPITSADIEKEKQDKLRKAMLGL